MATDASPTSFHRPAYADAKARALQAELSLSSALLFLGAVALYWITRTHLNTFDAVSYANQISHLYPRTGNPLWLFHPHHLLFNLTGWLLWRGASKLGYVGGPLVVLQSLNALLGGTGLALFYLALRRLIQRSHGLPMLMVVGLALSFGYWICATDGRVNMPSMTLLLAAFYVLTRVMEHPTPRLSALAGALAGAAVLYHESAGLFLLVGLAGVLMAEYASFYLPPAARKQRRMNAMTYLAAWAGTVLVPYLLVSTLGLHLLSWAAFRQWMSSYSELGWWWNFNILHNLRLDAYALRHAAFVEPPGKQGTFHLNQATPAALRALYYATLAGWFVGVYAFFAALPLLWRSHQRPVMIVCVLWIALYASFFTVWSPGYFVFWVPVLVPVSILLALSLAHYRARRGGMSVNWLVGIWIALYATLNVQASIAPHTRPDSSPFQQEAEDVRSHTQPGDLILLAGAGDGAQYEVDIPYFADRDVLSLHTLLTGTERKHETQAEALGLAQAQIGQTLAAGHAVYALDELKHNRRTLDALHKRHPEWGQAETEALFAPYHRSLGWSGTRGPVWQLTPNTP